jgi:hypothetical protein
VGVLSKKEEQIILLFSSYSPSSFIFSSFFLLPNNRYGTFSPDAILNGATKSVQYYYNPSCSLIEITIPFFWDQAGVKKRNCNGNIFILFEVYL